MADEIKKTLYGKVTRIRSNSGVSNDRVYIEIKVKAKTYWCWVVPDNEGAKWIVQIAFTSRINNLDIYMFGREQVYDYNEEDRLRYEIMEFGIE